MQYAASREIDSYLYNPKTIKPTEYPTSSKHAPAVVSGKERSLALTGFPGPFVLVQRQNRSSSMSFVHPDQEVRARHIDRVHAA